MDYKPEHNKGSYKVQKENMGGKVLDIGLGNDFLSLTTKTK